MNEIVTFISQVGFPIAACAAMFWQNEQQSKRHKEESDRWAQTLANNTLAMEKLENAIIRLKDDIPDHVQ